MCARIIWMARHGPTLAGCVAGTFGRGCLYAGQQTGKGGGESSAWLAGIHGRAGDSSSPSIECPKCCRFRMGQGSDGAVRMVQRPHRPCGIRRPTASWRNRPTTKAAVWARMDRIRSACRPVSNSGAAATYRIQRPHRPHGLRGLRGLQRHPWLRRVQRPHGFLWAARAPATPRWRWLRRLCGDSRCKKRSRSNNYKRRVCERMLLDGAGKFEDKLHVRLFSNVSHTIAMFIDTRPGCITQLRSATSLSGRAP